MDKKGLRNELHSARLRKQNAERDADNKLLVVTKIRSTYPSCLFGLVNQETNFRFQKVSQSKIDSPYEAESMDFASSVVDIKEAMNAKKRVIEEKNEYLQQLGTVIESSEQAIKQMDNFIQQKIIQLL